MTADVGHLSLAAVVLAAGLAFLSAMAAGRFAIPGLLKVARGLTLAAAGFYTLAALALWTALVNSDFSLQYVARFTERALPTGYKLAAFWAGQEGSLLLWGWLVAVMSWLVLRQEDKYNAAIFDRPLNDRQDEGKRHVAHSTLRDAVWHPNQAFPGAIPGAVPGVLALVWGFFAVLMLFAADPFAVFAFPPEDGGGLNPLLQHPAMIAHPPLLFVGYAGYTIPFALMVGALVAGRKDNQWIAQSRVWLLGSWIFLTCGIVLGAWWAYLELGWGGYWAWDPVENASLLPWLTGTALMHSAMVQQHRGMLKIWNAVLTALTFLLCIFGTYLTRSGVIQSVHAFGESPVGDYFLTFLGIATVGSMVLLVVRRKLLVSERPLEGLVGREGFFMGANLLLTIIMVTTLGGTVSPIVAELAGRPQFKLEAGFYNNVVVPMGLILVLLMATGPLLSYGAGGDQKLKRGLFVPMVLALAGVGIAVAMGLHRPLALCSVGVGVLAVSVVVLEYVRACLAWRNIEGEMLLVAAGRVISASRRRYGAQLCHVGVVLMVAGITGSGLFQYESLLDLKAGQEQQAGRYTLKLERVKEYRHENYSALDAAVRATDPAGGSIVLHPQLRHYPRSDQVSAEVAVRPGWREDLYMTVAEVTPDGLMVVLKVIISPLVSWIWIGGAVMLCGGLLCALSISPGMKTAGTGLPVNERAGAKAGKGQAKGQRRISLIDTCEQSK
ncbi:MAG: heme lyase CcmF/NrfE family subunit [Phycisphaeraceae bacterium]|nr:heme lyase CcmF/NrfE family subunit [Phycisphaeraceae bacterium]